MSTSSRPQALVSLLPGDVDAMLVTKVVNVRYLSGFTGSTGALLVPRDGDPVLATDGRYDERARGEAPDVVLHITRTPAAELASLAASSGARRIAIERDHVTLAALSTMTAAADGAELVSVGDLVASLRIRKDADELELLRRACAITDAVFAELLEHLAPGVTERQVAWTLSEGMHRHGADGVSFDSIVAFGPHSAIPHHSPTDRPLLRGDLVKLDFGALVGGYHADMTRTLVCGTATAWQRELHACVSDVQQHCRDIAVPGALPAEIDQLARTLLGDAGYPLIHGLGHGVGLEIHESPFLTPASPPDPLELHVPVTVEPGAYITGRGGVRIEDIVVVADHEPEPLTNSTRELVEL